MNKELMDYPSSRGKDEYVARVLAHFPGWEAGAPAAYRKQGFLYAYVCEPFCKIGWSTSPQRRIWHLQKDAGKITGLRKHNLPTNFAVSIPGTLREEMRLHRLFAEHRVKTRKRLRVKTEWYRLEGAVADWVSIHSRNHSSQEAG